ncbi:bda63eea-8b5b-4905-a7ea-84f304687337 [Thermothielavioides terrestris]|jgi:nucleoside-diphosphate-sugar epimerase|uniref:NAD-dependent epimerase/dehydratase domain-containing protein n=2 Tax=Thermothielavioides terrestris TaxID=2587410 RepID=G2R663_THETT|nr:uncharacterized protein THITE_2116482 [Thermothielavioides terrestris NRRL 8126]AEO67600.1 hypothetical protein THITE_2116482 [Thermothielavioides terrestris NRRL 8126]SPQ25725.1 bda63eea-8b5b-4905-a7ea-84f304687337 [Thermothielavioides terrestris]
MASPAEQTLLVTGANGFVASHILKLALEKGYHVRGTVRSESSAASVRAKFPEHSDKLSLAVGPDLTKPELYAPAFAGTAKPITGVLHVAANFTLKVDDNRRDLLDPAIGGARGILEATARYGRDVRRVVLTSSFAANIDLSKGARAGYTYTEADWNPVTYEQAAAPGVDGATAYCASKALAEKAMWDWAAEHKPPFDLVSINPPWIFGPHVGGLRDLARLNESTAALHALIGAAEVPPPDYAGFADVRNVADAHLAAFEKPEAGGQRFIVGLHFDYQSVVDSVRREVPELRDRLPVGKPGKVPEMYELDGSKAERVLGIRYIPLERSMRDSFVQFVEAEQALAAASA